jgi:D-arabinose 1-dehydrogenase-like Zn-dependent alcohol dehydrogenase
VCGWNTRGSVNAGPLEANRRQVRPRCPESAERWRTVSGWYSGTARDSQDTLEFSAQSGVHPIIEKFPLSNVAEAYEQMHRGKARFRAVLTM